MTFDFGQTQRHARSRKLHFTMHISSTQKPEIANTLADPRGVGGSNPAMASIMVLGRGPPPPQAAEGIVKGRWITEISRVFFSLASLAIILKM